MLVSKCNFTKVPDSAVASRQSGVACDMITTDKRRQLLPNTLCIPCNITRVLPAILAGPIMNLDLSDCLGILVQHLQRIFSTRSPIEALHHLAVDAQSQHSS